MSDLAWWQTLVSGAAGGAFTLGGQWLKAWFDRGSAQSIAAAERRAVLDDRRREFELANLEKARLVLSKFVTAVDTYRQLKPPSDADEDVHWAYVQSPEAQAYFEASDALYDVATVTLHMPVHKALRELRADAITDYLTGDWETVSEYRRRIQAARNAIGSRIRAIYDAADAP